MAHSAYPELGDSAIHKLVTVLGKLLALPLPFAEGVGSSSLNIGQIQGGYAPNVIADKAEARCWFAWWVTRRRCAPPCSKLPQNWPKWTSPGNSLRPPARRRGPAYHDRQVHHRHSQALELGEPLLLGPGSINVAHTPFEKLAKKELLEAVELYIKVARHLLG